MGSGTRYGRSTTPTRPRRHTLRTFDNAHAPEEHHEHRYIGSEKQEPIVTHGQVNDAMHAAELKLLRDWRDIVHEWENMR
jgi:hypothetical protein